MAPETKELSAEQLAQHPILLLLLAGLILLVLLFLFGSLSFWTWASLRLRRGIPVLPTQSWLPRVWGLIDVVVVILVMISSQVFVVRMTRDHWGLGAGQKFDEEQMPLSVMAFLGLANLATVVIAMVWMNARHAASMEQFGFGVKDFKKHCCIGAVAAVATLPIIHVFMLCLSQGTNTEYNHPLIKMMVENASLSAYLLGCFSAVLAAPLAEEFIFRVVLQGWLQSIESSKTHGQWIFGASAEQRGRDSVDTNALPEWGFQRDALETPIVSDPETSADDGPKPPERSSLWPVLISGTIFGIAHYGYGLSYIPLTVMGIVLGLLFRATGSIIPSLIVHVILNAFSMYALGVAILYQQAAAAH